MFVLETVVCQMNHQVGFIFNVLLSIILNAKPQIPRVIKDDGRITVNKHVTSDIEFFIVKEKRPHIMLD